MGYENYTIAVGIKGKDRIQENAEAILDALGYGFEDWVSGRRVLLTGASGLLGRTLARVFSLTDADLHLVTSTRFPDEIGASVHYANLANPNDCARLPRADIVISGANYAQPLRFMAEPLLALRSAAYGLMSLLELCEPGGRFLYFSSSEVYCDTHAAPPYAEADTGTVSPYHPRACYIQGKLFGEALVYLYRARGISTVAVRPGILYGPGYKPGDQRSWASFVDRAITQGKIELMDAGHVTRTFCHITDGLELVLSALWRGTQPVYNVGGQIPVTIADLARTIGGIAGVPVIVPEADHGVAGTPENLQLNISRARSEFGKTGFVTLEDGLSQTIAWAKDQSNA